MKKRVRHLPSYRKEFIPKEYKKSKYYQEFTRRVGERIRALRVEMNFSRETLSELTEISASDIAKYEKGRDAPLEQVAMLCVAFQITVDQLVEGIAIRYDGRSTELRKHKGRGVRSDGVRVVKIDTMPGKKEPPDGLRKWWERMNNFKVPEVKEGAREFGVFPKSGQLQPKIKRIRRKSREDQPNAASAEDDGSVTPG